MKKINSAFYLIHFIPYTLYSLDFKILFMTYPLKLVIQYEFILLQDCINFHRFTV